MIYLQRNIPSPNKIYNFSLSDFSGGLNNRKDILEDNESPEMLNMIFTSDDILSKRRGQKYVNGDEYTDPITFMDEYLGSGPENIGLRWGTARWGETLTNTTANLVVATDKKLYINNQFITDVQSTVTGISHIGNYYFVDGGNMYVYGTYPKVEGTYIKIIGTPPEDSTLMKIVSPTDDYEPLDREFVESPLETVTIQEIDSTGGVHKVKFNDKWHLIAVYNGMDLNVDVAYTVTYDDKGVALLEPIDPEVTKKVEGTKHLEGVTVYDYENNTICYEPCLFEIEDEYKGANVVPVNTRFIVSHKGRIFTSGDTDDDNNVFISDIENPYYFPVGTPIQIPPDSDRIVKLIVYDDSVIVARRTDIYALSGETNRLDAGLELFNLRKLNTHTGFANSTSCNLAHNYLFFIGYDGNAYSMAATRQSERIMVTNILNQTIDFNKFPINFNAMEMGLAISHFHNDVWYVQIKEKTLVFNYRNMTWVILEGLVANSWFTLNHELVWGSKHGRVVGFSNDYLDFGEQYKAYWVSKHFDMEEPSYYKHFKDFYITAKVFDGINSDMYVTFLIDRFRTEHYNTIKPEGEGGVFQSSPFYINRRGKHIQFVVKSGFIDEFKAVDLPGHLYSYTDMVDGEMVYVRLENSYYVFHEGYKFHYEPDYTQPGNAERMVAAAGWVKLDRVTGNHGMQFTEINFNYEERGRYLR